MKLTHRSYELLYILGSMDGPTETFNSQFSFQEILDYINQIDLEEYDNFDPRRLKNSLDSLISHNLIRQDGRDSLYSPTEKGRKIYKAVFETSEEKLPLNTKFWFDHWLEVITLNFLKKYLTEQFTVKQLSNETGISTTCVKRTLTKLVNQDQVKIQNSKFSYKLKPEKSEDFNDVFKSDLVLDIPITFGYNPVISVRNKLEEAVKNNNSSYEKELTTHFQKNSDQIVEFLTNILKQSILSE